MDVVTEEPFAYTIIKELMSKDKLRDLREHGEMRGQLYSVGAVQNYVWYLLQRSNSLNYKESFNAARNLTTRKSAEKSDIDIVLEVSSVLNSIGRRKEEVFRRRGICLEEGVSEAHLRTIEDYIGVHNLSDRGIQLGSTEAIGRMYEFIEREIEEYRSEVRDRDKERIRHIFGQ